MGFRVPGQSSRSEQLEKLAKQVPGQQNAQVTAAKNTANQQLQTAVAQMPTAAAPTTAQTQQMGATMAANQGQAAIQAQQTGMQNSQQLQQTGMQQGQMESKKQLLDKKLGIQQKSRELQNKLSTVSEDFKKELFDKETTFAKDEMGRTYFNERQLLDWKLQQAASQEELANFELQSRQMAEKKMQILKTSHAKIKQTLQNGYDELDQKLDQDSILKLAEAKRKLEEKIRKQKAKQGGLAAMFSAGGTILGAAVGTMIAPGAGTAAGAAIGGGLGQAAGGLATQ